MAFFFLKWTKFLLRGWVLTWLQSKGKSENFPMGTYKITFSMFTELEVRGRIKALWSPSSTSCEEAGILQTLSQGSKNMNYMHRLRTNTHRGLRVLRFPVWDPGGFQQSLELCSLPMTRQALNPHPRDLWTVFPGHLIPASKSCPQILATNLLFLPRMLGYLKMFSIE